ncbi:DNA repair helicase (rad3) [Allomyces macrogynus ATCC 38327]|uniref:Regulator of telomere elongation helicase 1 homolog n=1 Tax=Allomyces macrogynus (strain ATCC 38327) TaxID=578462 RepID=A0A0L0SIH0_ALLM3|nr:DNA repair helicase (rad3) [Allomyces macrogynus ATCC 38327]|eukprot:KNE62267.1 DNA repair helicase (rad3) [Allomyces macrogynus ATCC 38327]
MREYDLHGIKVKFPFDAYDCQLAFMDKVIAALQAKEHALLESPTGTGKTMCLLTATIAWRDAYIARNRASASVEIKYEVPTGFLPKQESGLSSSSSAKPKTEKPLDAPTIYYSSRTHSQLTQVIRELKRSGYIVKTAVIGSREHLCIHPDVIKQPTSAAQGRACRRKIATRTCGFYSKAEKTKVNEIYDIEEIVQYAKDRETCPFFVSRNSLADADIVLLPYNYLIDPNNRKQQNIELANAIIIFDEAHNLESSCTDAVSIDLSVQDVEQCIEEAKTCIHLSSATKEGGNPGDFKMLAETMQGLARAMRALALNNGSRTEPGTFFYEFLHKHQITWETVAGLRALLEAGTDLIVADTHASRTAKGALGNMGQFLDAVFRDEFQHQLNYYMQYFKVHVQESATSGTMTGSAARGGPGGAYRRGGGAVGGGAGSYRQTTFAASSAATTQRVFHFWCLHSGVAMRDLIKANVRSIILASGTLSPMASFAQEMDVPFKHMLENDHVILPSQILVGLVPRGPRELALTSSFQSRGDVSKQVEMGNAVDAIVRHVPQGVLGFFPSYGNMDGLLATWRQEGVLDRIAQSKVPFVEPKDKKDLLGVIGQFNAACESGLRGGLLFGVCRGKISEGIDFADHKGRAALILGIPYPNYRDPRVELKKAYLETMKRKGLNSLDGREWYQQQASRAVNQAIGRVVRHRHDYGAILLMDERFANAHVRQQLSRWVRPHLRLFNSFADLPNVLTNFFRNNAAMFPVASAADEDRAGMPLGYAGSALVPRHFGDLRLPPAPSRRALPPSDQPLPPSTGSLAVTTTVGNKRKSIFAKYSTTSTASTAADDASSTFTPFAKRPRLSDSQLLIASSTASGLSSTPATFLDACATATKPLTTIDSTLSYRAPLDMTISKRTAKFHVDPKDFKDLVREKLGARHVEFQQVLRKFKDGAVSVEGMMDQVLALFMSVDGPRAALFQGFVTFVPRDHKRAWMKMYSERSAG